MLLLGLAIWSCSCRSLVVWTDGEFFVVAVVVVVGVVVVVVAAAKIWFLLDF